MAKAEQTMDLKTTIAIFGTVFLAELGDKTQLATVLFASNRQNSALAVFFAAAAALVASTAIAVAAGSTLSHYVSTRHLSVVAGIGFIVIGAWTLWSALRGG
jgi:putative Ca2+/H+ antiporter (TMEM165/GDT1 family)